MKKPIVSILVEVNPKSVKDMLPSTFSNDPTSAPSDLLTETF